MFGFTSKERDRSGQLKQSTRYLQTAGYLLFPAAKEVVRWSPGSCVLLLTPPSSEGCWGMFRSESEADPRRLVQVKATRSKVCLDLAFVLEISIQGEESATYYRNFNTMLPQIVATRYIFKQMPTFNVLFKIYGEKNT